MLKCRSEVAEVCPGGVAGHKPASDIESRAIVNSEQEGLFLRGRPPLVDGAVVLPEFSKSGSAEAAVGTGLSLWLWDQPGEVFLDVGFDAGAGFAQGVKTQEFVGDELIIGRALERHELTQKGNGILGPVTALIASTGFDVEGFPVFKPKCAKLIEPRFAYF